MYIGETYSALLILIDLGFETIAAKLFYAVPPL
jgi:hypothetical protein